MSLIAQNGCGRKAALAVLDYMLAESRNLQILKHSLQAEFVSNPVKFFKEFVMPLLPKEMTLNLDNADSATTWNNIFETVAKMQSAPAPEPSSTDNAATRSTKKTKRKRGAK